jgi:chromosome partitioning protein
MKIISIGTLKGGTGKTTTAFNLAGMLAEKHRVLLMDLDPQCNLSTNVGVDVTKSGLKTTKNIFEGNARLQDVIYKKPVNGLPKLDVIPSSIQLTATELSIVSLAGRERIFSNFILDNRAELEAGYDYLITDTNPSMSMINQNAFLAADSIILVSDVSLNGIQGAELFIALWENARKQLRKSDNVKALIINNYDKRIKLSRELFDYCRANEDIKNLLIRTVIPASVKIKETELDHKPINTTGNIILTNKFNTIINTLKRRKVL